MAIERKQRPEHPIGSMERYRRLMGTLLARGLASIEGEEGTAKIAGAKYTVIGPGSVIDGGVAIDIGSKTAIIVDTESDPVLEAFVKRMKPAYDRIAHKETRKEGLVGLAAIVNYALEYDQDAIISTYRDDFQSNQAVVMRPLGEFITIKKGICFQRALLTGVALEYVKKTGVLSADTDISVESGYSDDLGEYHAFVRLCTDDELWQIDSAQRRDELASFIGIVKK